MTLSQLEVTGAEVYAVSIADQLISNGHKVFILSDTLTKPTTANYISVPFSKRTIYHRIKNILFLIKFINSNDIQIIHAHSRASAWVSCLAGGICNIPVITTVHGRQATHLSRKIFPAFGFYIVAVCEMVKQQLIQELKINEGKIEVLRNGFNIEEKRENSVNNSQQIVTILTRLTGPKGELAFKLLELIQKNLADFQGIEFRVVGGQNLPEHFKQFKENFRFLGYVESPEKYIAESSVVIGSGRAAAESLLMNKPTIAIGEACSIGLITLSNIELAIKTNFGDTDESERNFDFNKILNDLKTALTVTNCDPMVCEKLKMEYDLTRITKRLEYIYRSVIVKYYHKEIPVIMYHSIADNNKNAGKHGIYVTKELFETHLHYLHSKGYQTLYFSDLKKIIDSAIRGKYILITFDDGYEDNYYNALPVLKKYNMKATVFLVADKTYNEWDCKNPGDVEYKLLDKNLINKMANEGIMFGSHTLSHPDLTLLNRSDIAKEISESKKILEEKVGREITAFAYPYGKLNAEVKSAVRNAGYQFGIATDSGPLAIHEDFFEIRRIIIFPNTNLSGFKRKINGNYTFKRVKRNKQNYPLVHQP